MAILLGSKPTTAPLRRIIWKFSHWLALSGVAEAGALRGAASGLESAVCVVCMNAPETRITCFDGTSDRSEEHTSELQSLMRISYAVFCLKNKRQRLLHRHNVNINVTTNR